MNAVTPIVATAIPSASAVEINAKLRQIEIDEKAAIRLGDYATDSMPNIRTVQHYSHLAADAETRAETARQDVARMIAAMLPGVDMKALAKALGEAVA